MNRGKIAIEKMCSLFEVSSSSYYNRKKQRSICKRSFSFDLVKKEFLASKGTYGSVRIARKLQKQGHALSQSSVARIMKELELYARPKPKYKATTDSAHDYKVAENLLQRNFQSERPNAKWVSDITYIRTQSGWAYLTTVIDLADRMVVGWNVSTDLTCKNTSYEALRKALFKRRVTDKLIFHSDRGVQYCCAEFRDLIKKNKNIRQSMSRKGNCWDNAVNESFFKTIKVESLNRNYYRNANDVRQTVFDYIERWYNTKRIHSSIDYQTPSEKHRTLTRTYESYNPKKTSDLNILKPIEV